MYDTLLDESNFDAATLFFVLHFLPDEEAKLALLKDIAVRLKDRGYLILASHQIIVPPAYNSLFMTAWKAFMAQQGMTPEAMQSFLQQCEQGLYPSSDEQIAALLAATGFERPAKFFQTYFQGAWIC